jgi:arylformamidase
MVVDATGTEFIGPDVLPASLPPRVLFKTLAWTDHRAFPETVPTLLPETVAALERAEVVLIGVDVPSVDSIDSKTLPLHHALTEAGIRVLESLDLRRAEPGRYELIALPLPFTQGDASPVRAVLRRV